MNRTDHNTNNSFDSFGENDRVKRFFFVHVEQI